MTPLGRSPDLGLGAFDDDQVVLDVRRFAAHLIQSIVRDAQRAGTLTARDREAIIAAAAARRPLPGSERRLAAKLAAKFWLVNSELAGEVISTLAGVQRPAAEVLESVNRGLEAVTAVDRMPVIVVDLRQLHAPPWQPQPTRPTCRRVLRTGAAGAHRTACWSDRRRPRRIPRDGIL